jgi:hypothetical protein
MSELIGDRPAGTLAAIVRAGLAERPDDAPGTYFVPSPGLLDVALRLVDAGIAIEVLAELEPMVRRGLRDTAEEVVDYFVDNRGLGDPGDHDQLTASIEALRSMGANAINIIFAQELERTLSALLENGAAGRSKSKNRGRRRGRRRRRS